MTLDELKAEAKKLGYHLVKNNPKNRRYRACGISLRWRIS